MAIQTIGVGAVANDGTGDQLRTAFTKINQMMANDIYPLITDADIAALAALASTAGMLSRTGAGAFVARTLTGTSPVQVANGTGASGNPTISVDASTTSASGIVELATTAETLAGTDTVRAVTPAGIAGAFTTVAWTPTMLLGGSATGMVYDTGQTAGQAIIFGHLMLFTGRLTLTTKGSGTGAVTIGGLPATTAARSAAMIATATGFTVTGALLASLGGGTTTIALRQSSAAGNAAITDTAISSSTDITFAGFVFV